MKYVGLLTFSLFVLLKTTLYAQTNQSVVWRAQGPYSHQFSSILSSHGDTLISYDFYNGSNKDLETSIQFFYQSVDAAQSWSPIPVETISSNRKTDSVLDTVITTEGKWTEYEPGVFGTPTGTIHVYKDGTIQTFEIKDGRNEKIAVDPKNTQIMYRYGNASTYAGVHKSEDGGQTWFNSSLGLPLKDQKIQTVYQLFLYPYNTSIMYARLWGGEDHVSTDGGQIWHELTSFKFNDIIWDADSPYPLMTAKNVGGYIDEDIIGRQTVYSIWSLHYITANYRSLQPLYVIPDSLAAQEIHIDRVVGNIYVLLNRTYGSDGKKSAIVRLDSNGIFRDMMYLDFEAYRIHATDLNYIDSSAQGTDERIYLSTPFGFFVSDYGRDDWRERLKRGTGRIGNGSAYSIAGVRVDSSGDCNYAQGETGFGVGKVVVEKGVADISWQRTEKHKPHIFTGDRLGRIRGDGVIDEQNSIRYIWSADGKLEKRLTVGSSGEISSIDLSIPQSNVIYDMLIRPDLPTTLYLSTDTGIYVSENGGFRWGAIEGAKGIFKFMYDPRDSTRIYGASPQSILITDNLWDTYTVISGPGPEITSVDMWYAPTEEDPILIIGTKEGVYTAIWGGQSASIAGDFNQDGEVSFPDFLQFAQGFGKKNGEVGFDSLYDLDGDGNVGFGDFLIFAQAFGTKAQG